MRNLTIAADTTPEAAWVQMQIYRRMPMEQRLNQAFGMWSFMREMCGAGVRTRHPEYTDEQVHYAVIQMNLGPELFGKAYPGVCLP
jgi:hypothetical protein